MVFYFSTVSLPDSDPTESPWLMFMGRDKFENEELLKYAFPEDVWFHVDNLSSAHVYLRRPSMEIGIDAIPAEVLAQCAQLVKANSIEGCKRDQVDVVYCAHSNLCKGKNFEAGAVAYRDERQNRFLRGVQKDRDLLRKLEKTKTEPFSAASVVEQLRQLREDRDCEEKKRTAAARKKEERRLIEERRKDKEQADVEGYVDFMKKTDLKTSNKDANWAGDGTAEHCREVEDSFM